MAAKKINWRLAHNIATAIADKAFDHLKSPLETELEKFADEAYEIIVPAIKACEPFRLTKKDDVVRIQITNSESEIEDDEHFKIDVYKRGKDIPFVKTWHSYAVVYNPDLFERAKPVYERLTELNQKRFRLFEELKSQLEGKTISAAMKAWPEAADIIAEMAGVTEGVPLTTPLEVLLARFLPMLPAPQPEGV